MSNVKLTMGARKVPLGLIPMRALGGTARVLGYGGKKHAPGNFVEQSLADAGAAYDHAAMRHRMETQELSGLVTAKSLAARDEESGLPHIDHLIASLLILRVLMIRDGALPMDPGEGNEPPKHEAPKSVEIAGIAVPRTKSDGNVKIVCRRCYGDPRGELIDCDGSAGYSRCPECNPVIPANPRKGY